jgi:hypothetical protein
VRRVLALATLAAVSQLPSGTGLRIALPDWSGSARCVVRGADGSAATITATARKELVLQCPSGQLRSQRAEQLSCDVEGAEPVDVSLATACDSASLPLRRANGVVTVPPQETALTIDWLEIGKQGDLVTLATRTFEPDARAQIPVSIADTRLVRFSLKGFAPVSVSSPAMTGLREFILPPPVKGAELLLRRPNSPVTIETYGLTGVDHSVANYEAGEGQLLAVRGLQAGDYELVPRYAGGVSAKARKITLADGQAVFVEVPREPVGGVEVNLAATNCSAARAIDVASLTVETTVLPSSSGTRSTTIDTHVVSGAPTGCQTRFGGLPTGTYEVSVANWKNETFLRRRFDVQAQKFTEVAALGDIRLTGRVTLGKRPLDAAVIEFRPVGSSRPTTGDRIDSRPTNVARIDERGNYAVDFERPGGYVATIRIASVPAPGQERRVEVKPGESIFDWDLSGGSVTVTLQNFYPANGGSIQFDLEQVEPRPSEGRNGFSYRFSAAEKRLENGEVTFEGLAFATFALRARYSPSQPGARKKASKSAGFSIDLAKPAAKVSLTLEDNRGEILLVAQDGRAVGGAQVYGLGISSRETQPGTYSMEGFTPGLPIHIRAAGYTPACRLAPETAVTVTLERGRTLEVQFPGLASSRPVGWLMWAGSECRVAFDAFPFVALPDGPDGTPRFSVANLPVVGEMTFIPAEGPARVLSVAEARPVIIRVPKN